MKLFFVIVLSVLTNFQSNNLINSVWGHKITATRNNTLTFKPNGLVLEYDCELDYVFHSNYKVKGDTIIIKGKDDSHSEDNGKVTLYWVTKYLIKGNALYVIENKICDHGKWKNRNIKPNGTPTYSRTK